MIRTLPKRRVLTVDVTTGTFQEQVAWIMDRAAAGNPSYVCCVNVHMAMEARDPGFADVVNAAGMATPDGMPIVRSFKFLHGIRQERVAGNDLMPALLAEAARMGVGVFLYGGAAETLAMIAARARREFVGIRIVGTYAPPFRPFEEMAFDVDARRIADSGAGLVLVSLGCPKQERWMAQMQGRFPAVSVGLGGAFLLYAGIDSRAPRWMRDLSLEWLYRLALEPGRLWKRYLTTNTRFIAMLVGAILRGRSKRE